MIDDADILVEFEGGPEHLIDLFKCRELCEKAGLDTGMLDDILKKEIYIFAVATDRAFKEVQSSYEQQFNKENNVISLVKDTPE